VRTGRLHVAADDNSAAIGPAAPRGRATIKQSPEHSAEHVTDRQTTMAKGDKQTAFIAVNAAC